MWLADAEKAGQQFRSERCAEEIPRRTKDAMAKQKASGAVLGNPDTLETQRLGAAAKTTKSDAMVKPITDVLRSIPDHEKLSLARFGEHLNARGIVTGASQP
jgi:hypothetical protein